MYLKTLFFVSIFVWCGTFSVKDIQLKKVFYAATFDRIEKKPFDFLPCIACDDDLIIHTAFTLCYSEKNEQAKWVAYRLTDQMCDNNGEARTNNFRIDKEVNSGSSAPEDYKKSGYDRGHLCPAGDMGWSEEAMSESFLMSNMSPQVPAFNRGIWKKLETDVRGWAKKNNEIYIVTAGVLVDGLQTIGSNKVAVPCYYYKVILDYKLPEFKAIAFVLPNAGSQQSIFDFVVSIDSVENLTGIDFFPALPDSVENYLESQINIEKWEK